MNKRWMAWAAALGVGLGGTAAFGQVDLERFERQLELIRRQTRLEAPIAVPAAQRTLIDVGGYVGFNFLAVDDTTQNTHILRQTVATGYAHVNLDGVHDFFVRVRTTYDDFDSGDSFDGSGDDWVEPTLDRATYRFNLAQYMAAYEGKTIDTNLIVQGGRQLVHWANGLVLSQELDGGVIDLIHEPFDLQVVVGRTRTSSTDIDSSRPDFKGDTQRLFAGGMLSIQAAPRHRPYLYGLVQEDQNDDQTLTSGTTSTRFNYDSYYLGGGATGSFTDQLVYGVEFAYEGGSGLSNSFNNTTFLPITQTEENIHAWALDALLDYLFGDAHRSRISGELLVASGDDDRLTTTNTFGGNQAGTDDNAFNGFGLMNTGLAFGTSVSNLIMLRGGASTFPLAGNARFDRLQVGVDLFVFNKYDDEAPIDETTSSDSYLGFESDFFATWQVTSDLIVTARYGVFLPGGAIPGDDDARHFFFTGVTLAF